MRISQRERTSLVRLSVRGEMLPAKRPANQSQPANVRAQFCSMVLKCVETIGIQNHGYLAFAHQRTHQLRRLRIARNSGTYGEHGLALAQRVNAPPGGELPGNCAFFGLLKRLRHELGIKS